MWTLPNVLTGLRLVAVPFLAAVLVVAGDSPDGRAVALGLFVAASLTDLADGWLARRWNQCTEFGALVDPIADKALVVTALVCLSDQGPIPWWATAVVLARELAVTAVRLGVVRHGVIPASRGGKIKTVSQTALIVVALAAPGSTALIMPMVVITVAWTVVTGIDYGVKAAALARRSAPPVPAGRRPAVVRSLDVAPALLPDLRQQGGGTGSSRVRS